MKPSSTTPAPVSGPPVTRRDFLSRAAGASVVFGVPNIVTFPLFGAEAPGNQIRVAQIGCGNIGGNYHIPTLMPMPDVRIVAVADAYKSRRDAQAAKLNRHYGDPNAVTAHGDFREMLARADVDAVIVGAHDNWHTPMSIAAVLAGKDVYCQKPLALDYSLTPLLRRVVNEKKRVFQFGTQYRSGGPHGRYRHMIQLVKNGYIGKLESIDIWSRDVSHDVGAYHVKPYGSAVEAPVPPDLDFDAWMGPSHMVPYTVDRATNWGGYHCPETSLGFIAGCAIHELGLVQWANTADDTSPVRYQGTGLVPAEGVFRTLARWDVNCDYANGVKMRLMDCRTAREVIGDSLGRKWRDGDGVVFRGSEGWISDAMGFCSSNPAIWKQAAKPSDTELPVSMEHNRNFIDCVKSRQETICPVEMAIRCDAIPHLATIAAVTGRAIQWDPAKEEIVGDAEAAKMLTRPFREKWKVW